MLLSMASWSIHRPSPESSIRPANADSSGSLLSAAAARSMSQDEMTLELRHASAIASSFRSNFSLAGDAEFAVASRRSKPSAIACIMPYSIPLWTIFTKRPEPEAPVDLPPSEWPNFYFRIGHEGGMEWRGSTSRKRSSASCVKRRSCWHRKAERICTVRLSPKFHFRRQAAQPCSQAPSRLQSKHQQGFRKRQTATRPR